MCAKVTTDVHTKSCSRHLHSRISTRPWPKDAPIIEHFALLLQKVKVGTRAAKRTTVPLLYNLEDSVDGLDVIDFPGIDDSDHTAPELADLLLTLAQIIVFVVDYRLVASTYEQQGHFAAHILMA